MRSGRALGGGVRSGRALGGGDVDGGGARVARWGEQDGRRDEKPSVRRRAKEEGNIWGGAFCLG